MFLGVQSPWRTFLPYLKLQGDTNLGQTGNAWRPEPWGWNGGRGINAPQGVGLCLLPQCRLCWVPKAERTLHPHLESHGVGSSQKYPQRQLGLVGPVAPQAMGPSCHAQSSQEEAEVGCKTQAGRMSANVTKLLHIPQAFFSSAWGPTGNGVRRRICRVKEELITWGNAAFLLICSFPVPGRWWRERSSRNFDLWTSFFLYQTNLLFANVPWQSWCKIIITLVCICNSVLHAHSPQSWDWSLCCLETSMPGRVLYEDHISNGSAIIMVPQALVWMKSGQT